MAIDAAQVMQAVYNLLFTSVTTPPTGIPTPTGFENTVITLEKPGRPIRVADYQKAWNPGKKTSDALATRRFSLLVDVAPALTEQYQPNGQFISQVYQQVLNAKVELQHPSAIEMAAYTEAERFLFREVTVIDEEAGQQTTKQIDSAIYRNYKQAKADYAQAVATYHAHYLEAMQTEAGRQQWPIMGNLFRTPVEIAWNQLQAAEASRVEDALATLEQTGKQQIARMFQDAKQQFVGYQRPDSLHPATLFAASYALPSNWTDLSQAWAQVSLTSESWQSQTEATGNRTTRTITQQSSTQADRPPLDRSSLDHPPEQAEGLWLIESAQSSQRYPIDTRTTNLNLAFEYALVVIERPWLRLDLFGLPGWKIDNLGAGAFSNGQKTNQALKLLPLIPQSFVMIRNLQIQANWGNQDLERIDQIIRNRITSAFGSFLLSRHTETVRFEAQFGQNTLRVVEPQILGWINTITPASPPIDGIRQN